MSAAEELRRSRIDRWLKHGGVVLAASDRAARTIVARFDAQRRAEGQRAWQTPAVFAWDTWVREQWAGRNHAGQVLLNPSQERALWGKVIRAGQRTHQMDGLAPIMNPGRLANAAQRATQLLADFAPESLRVSGRIGWTEDSAIYSGWLAEFEARCLQERFISASRLVLELAGTLANRAEEDRPPLLLVGFDRLLKTQRRLLDLWGNWELDAEGERPLTIQYVSARDGARELDACVEWLEQKLKAKPDARLMVVTTALQERRGQVERALLEKPDIAFEFSLGVPLGQVGLVRGALLLLRWLRMPIAEAELDWLISSGLGMASYEESQALAHGMQEARRRGRQRPEWALTDFVAEVSDEQTLQSWIDRMTSASNLLHVAETNLNATKPRTQPPMEWALSTGELLETMHWPGYSPLGTVAFQAQKRWERVLEECGSLGFDGSSMVWQEFLAAITEAAAQTIFAVESINAAVQVTEPFAAAGQLVDGIWFLGASEEEWPGRGQVNPLLPLGLQRDAEMPHASSQADWDLALGATQRLLRSADEVLFSFARHGKESETRPSRLMTTLLGLPVALAEQTRPETVIFTETYHDQGRVPFPGSAIRGGARALTQQSLCPFQAFGMIRLGAEDWEFAEAGLNARQRGHLIHAVMQKVWTRLGGSTDLASLLDTGVVQEFVEECVLEAMGEEFDPRRRNSIPARFPKQYLTLEAERLVRLVAQWLTYEGTRLSFRVESTEVGSDVQVAGLRLKLRLDRVDVLPDGSRLVMDYKTGDIGPKAWMDDRPDDVQLPLYAAFAVKEGSKKLEGLVFARLKAGKMEFSGRVRDAQGSLIAGLGGRTSLVKDPLTDDQLAAWRSLIEQLGRDFVDGKAEVDPKNPVKTCERCCLHAVCRISENTSLAALAEAESESDAEGTGE